MVDLKTFDLKSIGIQLLTTLIGSSLVITILTDFYTSFNEDINQPDIDISVKENVKSFISNSNTSQIGYIIQIVNKGEKPANNLDILIEFPDANKIFPIVNKQIQLNKPPEIKQTTISGNLTKLPKNGEVIIETNYIVNKSRDQSFSLNLDYFSDYFNKFRTSNNFENKCSITIAYDEGYNKYDCTSNVIPYSNYFKLVNLLLIPTFIIFFIYTIKNIFLSKIKQYKEQNSKYTIIKNIINDINIVRNVLMENVKSHRYFNFKLWDTLKYDVKINIFNNYDDFKQINDFYNTLKQRNSFIKKDNYHNLNSLNHKSLIIADSIYKSINWNQYYKSINNLISLPKIPTIITVTFCISFLGEIAIFYFLEPYSGGFIPSLILRTILSFFLFYLLFKYKLFTTKISFLDEAQKRNLKRKKLKVLILSLFIIGLPNYPIFALIYGEDFFLYSHLEILNFILIFNILADFLRCYSLLFIIDKISNNKYSKSNYVNLISKFSIIIFNLFFGMIILTYIRNMYNDMDNFDYIISIAITIFAFLIFISIIYYIIGRNLINIQIRKFISINSIVSLFLIVGVLGLSIILILRNKFNFLPSPFQLFIHDNSFYGLLFLIGFVNIVYLLIFPLSLGFLKKSLDTNLKNKPSYLYNNFIYRLRKNIAPLSSIVCVSIILLLSIYFSIPFSSFIVETISNYMNSTDLTFNAKQIMVADQDTLFVLTDGSDDYPHILPSGFVGIDPYYKEVYSHIPLKTDCISDIIYNYINHNIYFLDECKNIIIVSSSNRNSKIIENLPFTYYPKKISLNPETNELLILVNNYINNQNSLLMLKLDRNDNILIENWVNISKIFYPISNINLNPVSEKLYFSTETKIYEYNNYSKFFSVKNYTINNKDNDLKTIFKTHELQEIDFFTIERYSNILYVMQDNRFYYHDLTSENLSYLELPFKGDYMAANPFNPTEIYISDKNSLHFINSNNDKNLKLEYKNEKIDFCIDYKKDDKETENKFSSIC